MEPECDPRTSKALNAMKRLGIGPQTVKPVLSRLLKLYNGNWELIEEDNFRTLADAIFENADDKVMAEENSDTVNEDVKPPLKKQNQGILKGDVLSVGGKKRIIENSKEGIVPKTSSAMKIAEASSFSRDPAHEPHCRVGPAQSRGKHMDLSQTNSAPYEEKSFLRPASNAFHANREPSYPGSAPKKRKIEVNHEDKNAIVLRRKQPSDPPPHLGSTNTSQHSDSRNMRNESSSVDDSQTTYDIASSTSGYVKLSLTLCHAVQQHNICIPSAGEVLRFAESHCQKFCATFGAHFSLLQLLNELCERFFHTVMTRSSTKRLPGDNCHRPLGLGEDVGNDHLEDDPGKRLSTSSELSHSQSLAIVQERHDKKRVFHSYSDITKGAENVKISLLDEIGTESLPRFTYCPENITYESAYVHISLARISDEDCCRKCKGDCLSSSIPCACARDTGGEFAYTREGLLTEKFLKSCIALKLEPRNQDLFYCQDCPLERAKNGRTPEKCKGHLLRKFIKECWRKCSCQMRCGNRVVQRGITRKLQVFLTSKGKGWGLRTLEELPEGAFVCEYVGEILTNIELYERNKKSHGIGKHVYPVLLDADWATEGVLKDEDALCLDATHYGNVARFINHRCYDGNIIEVPVQVETPDRHYYHLAFFTKRKVDALEELTWDYGIDFDDNSHPIQAFQCCCGSQYCRDRKGRTN